MRYHWDKAKRAANLLKHGLDLADAQWVIESDQTVAFEDNRFNYDEQRLITIGPLINQLVVIVTTETETECRVISMRKAEPNEKKFYFTHYS